MEPRAPVPDSPTRALARVRPNLFHATAYGAWPLIAEHGLRTAADAAAGAGRESLDRLRSTPVDLDLPGGYRVRVRDQRAMERAGIEDHLDGVDLAEWLALLNARVFLFARQKDLTTLIARYQREGQDVLTFDTARLLAAAGRRVEVTDVSPGAPQPFAHCPCRGRDTFVPLADYRGAVEDIAEVTVVGGLDDVTRLVRRVVRQHPDRGPEVLL